MTKGVKQVWKRKTTKRKHTGKVPQHMGWVPGATTKNEITIGGDLSKHMGVERGEEKRVKKSINYYKAAMKQEKGGGSQALCG